MIGTRHRRMRRAVLFGMLFVLLSTSTGLLAPPLAHAALDDTSIPGKPFTPGGVNTLSDTHTQSVHRVYLMRRQVATFDLVAGVSTDFDLFLYPPEAENFTTPAVAHSVTDGTSAESIEYEAESTGWHYLRVKQWAGEGVYKVDYSVRWRTGFMWTPATVRVWGPDRYETAVAIAEENFPGWRNVNHVIIASGEDRAAADPLSASGLVWAYGGPIMLVRANSAPECVLQALEDIAAENGPFELHIVGGPVSVSADVLSDIAARVPGVIFDRLFPYDDRYTLAASVARRRETERPGETFNSWLRPTGRALIANGADPEKFCDALALSPVCAATGWPILLVREDSVPGPTRDVLLDLDLRSRTAAGGPATISNACLAELDAGAATCNRVWGRDRYATAVAVMTTFADADFLPPLDDEILGVTAKLPDALTGGAFLGLRRSCILLTRPASLPDPSWNCIHAHDHKIAFVFGGPVSVEPAVLDDIYEASMP